MKFKDNFSEDLLVMLKKYKFKYLKVETSKSIKTIQKEPTTSYFITYTPE